MSKDQVTENDYYPTDREILAAMVSELMAECVRLGISITYSGEKYGHGLVIGDSGSSGRVIAIKHDQDAAAKVSGWIKKLCGYKTPAEAQAGLFA